MTPSPKRINLALQGGGAHGAFTWGVLDRFLDDDTVEIAGISGTSAGALNGAAYKAGWLEGGRDGARANLDWLWQQMGALGDMRMAHWMRGFMPSAAVVSDAISYSPAYVWADAASRLTTPYALGPFYRNPLQNVANAFHYDKVCAKDGPQLHICATNVRTGKIRVFTGDDISTDAILASACLPTLFQAVEIEDPASGQIESYWDGGYSGNPALFPLFDPALPDDIVIVNINPLERDALPLNAQQIQNRINEISFNSSLLRELRAIAFVQRLLRQGTLEQGTMKHVHVHMVADDALMNTLSEATKLVPNPALLAQLKFAGRAAADKFLTAHRDDLNQRSTIDLADMLA